MGAEPLLEQLIDALQQLRARVIQVRSGEPAENVLAAGELRLMFTNALTINNTLGTSRVPGTLDEIQDGVREMDKSIALMDALRAIKPDYLLETIDAAISVAVSQRLAPASPVDADRRRHR